MTEKFDQQKSALTKRFASSSDSCAIATHHLLQPDRPIISMHVHNKALDNVYPAANVNPFSPNSLSLSKKRSRTQSGLNNSMPDILMRTTNQSMRTSTKQSSFNAATTTAVHQNNNNNNNNNQISSMHGRSVASLFSNYIEASTTTTVDDDGATDIVQAPKRLALQDSNISRYEKEFLQLSRIGEYFGWDKFLRTVQHLNKKQGGLSRLVIA